MKVLMVSDFPALGIPPKGGVQMATLNLVPELGREMQRRGGQLDILTFTKPGTTAGTERFEWGNLHWHPRCKNSFLSVAIAERQKVKRYANELNVDIIHSQAQACWLPNIPAKKNILTIHGIPELAHMHDARSPFMLFRGWLRSRIMKQLEYRGRLRTHSIVAISGYTADAYEKEKPKMHRIENALSNFLLMDRDFNSDKNYIAYIGRVIPIKNLQLVISAMKQIESLLRENCVRLKIWSPEDPLHRKYKDECEQMIRSLYIEDLIDWCGSIAPDQLHIAYSGAIVSVLGSFQENAPMTIAESLSQGVPVVATNVGSVADMICHGIDGSVIEPNNVSSMAEALSFWISNEKARLQSSDFSIKKSRDRWSSMKIARQTAELYYSLL